MLEIFLRESAAELTNVPLILLQQTAVLGILCMVLMVFPNREFGTNRDREGYGIVLGVSGYLLTALVADFIQLPSKPYLRNDILFLAGVLGGWRGGAICSALMLVARFQFGGMGHAMAAVVDIGIVTAGGIMMHGWFVRQNPLDFALRHLLLLWLARTACGFVAIMALMLLRLVPENVGWSVVARRAFTALPALALMAGLLALFRVKARHRQLIRQQLESAKTHVLTGLPNRRALQEHLETRFQAVAAPPPVLVVLESANYVEMLLAEGHGWCDNMWARLALLLRGEYARDLLAAHDPRIFQFSDTAVAIVLHSADVKDIERTGLVMNLHRILALQLQTPLGKGPSPQLRLSVTACQPNEQGSAAAVLRDISLRLQRPANGGAAVRYLHHSIAEAAAFDDKILTMLVEWIENHSPPMAYQAKCTLATGQVTGAEALLRADDGAGHPIPPPRILAVASRHQLLAAFEWSTIEAVVCDALRLAPNVSLAVNVSGASLATSGFAQRLYDLLTSVQLSASRLTLELTEYSALPEVESVNENVRLLTEHGVKLALDDFGAGYSGLKLLARIPFGEIKIDQDMVALIQLPRMRSAIQLALESAHRYEATFVAEGVETQAQRDALLDMGIGHGQGHLFSRPLTIDGFVDWLNQTAGARAGSSSVRLAPDGVHCGG